MMNTYSKSHGTAPLYALDKNQKNKVKDNN